MAQKITLTYADGREDTHDFRPPLADLVAMERHFGVSSQALSNGEARIEWIAFIIWQAERRRGEGRDFDQWLETVVDLDMADTEEAEPVDPTPAPRPQEAPTG